MARLRNQRRRPPPEAATDPIWWDQRVRDPAVRILVLSVFCTMLAMAGPALFTFLKWVPYLPVVGVLPSYGAILALGHWGPSFALGVLTDAIASSAVVVLCGLLWLGITGLDIWAVVNLVWWVVGYYLGTLTPAASAHGTLYGTLVTGILTMLLVMLDVIVLVAYLQIGVVTGALAHANDRRGMDDEDDNDDETEDDEDE
jgi:uncharacterized membrane protein